jgi:hypothetical protein
MWSSWVKEKGTTHVMYIAKLKDGPKRVKKTFSVILERVSEMVWWRGEKMGSHRKRFLNLKCISPLKMLTSPLFEETLGAFLSLPLFSLFLLCVLRTWGFWWHLRRKSLLQKLLFKWLQYTSGGCIFRNGVMHATWLNHDYGVGGVLDILQVDAYSRVELCMPILLGEPSK